jgi:hypothetical protein
MTLGVDGNGKDCTATSAQFKTDIVFRPAYNETLGTPFSGHAWIVADASVSSQARFGQSMAWSVCLSPERT